MQSYPTQKRNVLGTLNDTLSEELPAVRNRIRTLQAELQLLLEYESKLAFLESFLASGAAEDSDDRRES